MSWFTELLHRGVKEKETNSTTTATAPVKEVPKVKVDLVNSEHLFYDLLFGDTADASSKNDVIEKAIIDRVSEVLINPKNINFQSFPKALKDTLDKIDQDADIKDIQQSLEQDPILASDVVRLANTGAFSASSTNQVTSLQMAIARVGFASLKQVVTAAVMERMMTNVSPIYFKMFGEKIWQHSLLTARICELKAKTIGYDPYSAFFIGVIHDVGKIAIFSELVDAVQKAGGTTEPGSLYFRKVMTSLSKQLTYNIVRSWELPQAIIDPIKQHVVYGKVPSKNEFVDVLVESKLISELNLLYNEQMISLDEVGLIFEKRGYDESNIDFIAQYQAS
ncbi:HDOD domain-containing protein [Psychrobium sp. MM17-31]|uniref:HDOD domain-containing protein n=1 Tax=Psychrobium sp. MM17-31 TaxID=2917758 RepID=UPI001EF5DD12|nr:HDOD domain-containing protein [Psychrobium sp. MM17-31]MCG7532914.1 HDOD domain-containing protein [Psychrobium sp. MM17-31]